MEEDFNLSVSGRYDTSTSSIEKIKRAVQDAVDKIGSCDSVEEM